MGTRWRTGIATLAVAMATASATIAIAGGTECEKKAAARVNHDCVSCEASVTCLEKVTAAGGSAEIIPIANGLMIIYSTPAEKR